MKRQFYLKRLQNNVPKPVAMSKELYTLPHQSVSPREILESWVKNDYDTIEHVPVEDWHGGDVHPNSIRGFDDKFEVMEYLAELEGEPVVLDNLGEPITADPGSADPGSANPGSANPGSANPGSVE